MSIKAAQWQFKHLIHERVIRIFADNVNKVSLFTEIRLIVSFRYEISVKIVDDAWIHQSDSLGRLKINMA
jgi:hypothetical protein